MQTKAKSTCICKTSQCHSFADGFCYYSDKFDFNLLQFMFDTGISYIGFWEEWQMKNRTRKYDFFVILSYILAITLTLLHDKSLEHIFGISFFFSLFLLCIRNSYENNISKWIFDISVSYLFFLLFVICFSAFIRLCLQWFLPCPGIIPCQTAVQKVVYMKVGPICLPSSWSLCSWLAMCFLNTSSSRPTVLTRSPDSIAARRRNCIVFRTSSRQSRLHFSPCHSLWRSTHCAFVESKPAWAHGRPFDCPYEWCTPFSCASSRGTVPGFTRIVQ